MQHMVASDKRLFNIALGYWVLPAGAEKGTDHRHHRDILGTLTRGIDERL
jgi:hypothetical protein